MTQRQAAIFFKALGDENRIRILHLLKSGEKCACHLLEELDISQPTLSHHMKILCDCGIIESRKEGKWTYYRLSDSAVEEIIGFFEKLALNKEIEI